MNISRWSTCVVRLTLALTLLVIATRANAGPIQVTVSSDIVTVGDLFTLPISINGATNLTAFQFDMTFDPAVVQVLGVSEGADFANTAAAGAGFTLFSPGVIDNVTGLISLVSDSMNGLLFGTGLSRGVLATIDFQAIGPGRSTLALSNVLLVESGQFLSAANQDFAVATGNVETPEPASLVLLACGIGVLARKRQAPRPEP